jgi:hypothetical protein
MKLVHNITFSVQTYFLVQGHITFRTIFHSGKDGIGICQFMKAIHSMKTVR